MVASGPATLEGFAFLPSAETEKQDTSDLKTADE